MRYLTVVFSVLLLALLSPHNTHAHGYPTGDSVVIEKRTVVLIRRGKLVKDRPDRKKATISYPVIKNGLSDPTVLKRVRALLQLKNVFDTSLEEYRQDTWLTELDYNVNYNKNFILDITFTQEGVAAYPDTHQKHFAINLKTGHLIKAADIFKPASHESLAEMINKRLQAELKETIEQVNNDKSVDAEEKSRVPELYEGLKFEVQHLDDFSIDDNGITFLYDAGFPHAVQAYEPAGRYKFSYVELSQYLIRNDSPRDLIR